MSQQEFFCHNTKTGMKTRKAEKVQSPAENQSFTRKKTVILSGVIIEMGLKI